jgi:exodeoxyribonuclease VII small subunit
MGEKSFEDAMERLEEIVEKIESGEAGLDKSIELCEEAAKLVKSLKKRLNEAELKVKQLTRDEKGKLKADEGNEEALC